MSAGWRGAEARSSPIITTENEMDWINLNGNVVLNGIYQFRVICQTRLSHVHFKIEFLCTPRGILVEHKLHKARWCALVLHWNLENISNWLCTSFVKDGEHVAWSRTYEGQVMVHGHYLRRIFRFNIEVDSALEKRPCNVHKRISAGNWGCCYCKF